MTEEQNYTQNYSDRIKQTLEILAEGNKRYQNSEQYSPDFYGSELRSNTSRKSIMPLAIILGCSDARVPPEIIFQRKLGELFVIRTAGISIDDRVVGTIELGITVFKVPLIIILGHTNCRALEFAEDDVEFPGYSGQLVNSLKDAVKRTRSTHPRLNDEPLRLEIIRTNSQMVLENLLAQSDIIRQEHLSHRLAIVPALYDLKSGRVDFSPFAAIE